MTKPAHASGGTMVCCGKPLTLQPKKAPNPKKEYHVPVVEKPAKGILVKPGSVPPPVEEEHSIEWIEVLTRDFVYIKRLLPGEKPEAGFCVSDANVKAGACCNVHGFRTNCR